MTNQLKSFASMEALAKAVNLTRGQQYRVVPAAEHYAEIIAKASGRIDKAIFPADGGKLIEWTDLLHFEPNFGGLFSDQNFIPFQEKALWTTEFTMDKTEGTIGLIGLSNRHQRERAHMRHMTESSIKMDTQYWAVMDQIQAADLQDRRSPGTMMFRTEMELRKERLQRMHMSHANTWEALKGGCVRGRVIDPVSGREIIDNYERFGAKRAYMDLKLSDAGVIPMKAISNAMSFIKKNVFGPLVGIRAVCSQEFLNSFMYHPNVITPSINDKDNLGGTEPLYNDLINRGGFPFGGSLVFMPYNMGTNNNGKYYDYLLGNVGDEELTLDGAASDFRGMGVGLHWIGASGHPIPANSFTAKADTVLTEGKYVIPTGYCPESDYDQGMIDGVGAANTEKDNDAGVASADYFNTVSDRPTDEDTGASGEVNLGAWDRIKQGVCYLIPILAAPCYNIKWGPGNNLYLANRPGQPYYMMEKQDPYGHSHEFWMEWSAAIYNTHPQAMVKIFADISGDAAATI